MTLGNCKDTGIKARVHGVKTVMKTFEFVFECQLAVVLLRQTDNLSCTLHNPQISAAQGNAIAQDVIKHLSKDCNENSCSLIWEMLLKESLNGEEPKLYRKGKAPAKLNFHRSSSMFTLLLMMQQLKVLKKDSIKKILRNILAYKNFS